MKFEGQQVGTTYELTLKQLSKLRPDQEVLAYVWRSLAVIHCSLQCIFAGGQTSLVHSMQKLSELVQHTHEKFCPLSHLLEHREI